MAYIMQRTRVIVVSNLFPPIVVGGAEIVASRQALELMARGWTVDVFAGGSATENSPPGSLNLETDCGLTVHRLSLNSMDVSHNFRWPTAEERFRSVLAVCRPDIVYFHNVTGLGASLIPLAKEWGARTAVLLHDHWGFCFKNTILRNDGRVCADFEDCAQCRPTLTPAPGVVVPMRLRRDYVSWCLDTADLLLSPSRYLASAYHLSGLFHKPVSVLSNGIDLAAVPVSTKAPDAVIRFVSFAYIGEHKGIKTLVAAAKLLADDPDLAGRWDLSIVGDGYLSPWLESEVAGETLCENVRFLGRLAHDQAMRLMAGSDAIVLASIWPENEPVTLLEAIASGTAQIASRIGGNTELVADGQSGRLFTPGDAADLAGVMSDCIRHPETVAAFRAFNAGRRAAFDEVNTIDRLDGLLRALQSSTASDDLLVICDGSEPSADVEIAIHRLHLAIRGPRRIRLVWHGWASAEMWTAATLFWVWDDHRPLHQTMADTALRVGCPVLLPHSLARFSRSHPSEAVLSYDTLLDAVGTIAALAEIDLEGRAAPASLRFLARLTNALADRRSFYLPAQSE